MYMYHHFGFELPKERYECSKQYNANVHDH